MPIDLVLTSNFYKYVIGCCFNNSTPTGQSGYSSSTYTIYPAGNIICTDGSRQLTSIGTYNQLNRVAFLSSTDSYCRTICRIGTGETPMTEAQLRDSYDLEQVVSNADIQIIYNSPTRTFDDNTPAYHFAISIKNNGSTDFQFTELGLFQHREKYSTYADEYLWMYGVTKFVDNPIIVPFGGAKLLDIAISLPKPTA